MPIFFKIYFVKKKFYLFFILFTRWMNEFKNPIIFYYFFTRQNRKSFLFFSLSLIHRSYCQNEASLGHQTVTCASGLAGNDLVATHGDLQEIACGYGQWPRSRSQRPHASHLVGGDLMWVTLRRQPAVLYLRFWGYKSSFKIKGRSYVLLLFLD